MFLRRGNNAANNYEVNIMATTGYQHRDNGSVFRKNKGKVDRLSWDGKTWLPSAYRPTDLNSWPFEKIGTIEDPSK